MADMKKWFQPELTNKAVFEGIYPVVITQSKIFTKDAEKDGRKFQREVVEVCFKTLQDVPFPDTTTDRILVGQSYYFDVPFHVNALNGLARAAGVPNLTDSDQLEGKTLMVGFTNRSWEAQDSEVRTMPQFGFGLFSYAPIAENSAVEYIANDYAAPTEEEYKEWFKAKLAVYKQPK